MAFCMEWDLNLLLNNWAAVQMKLLKKFKASKALFPVLLPGYKKQFLSVVRKGEYILLIVLLYLYRPLTIQKRIHPCFTENQTSCS